MGVQECVEGSADQWAHACVHMSVCLVEGPATSEPRGTYKVDISGGCVLLVRGLAGGL